MIPLSRIHGCNNALFVTPEYNQLMDTASCLSPTMTSSGLCPIHALYHAADSVHDEPKLDSSVAPSPNVTVYAAVDSAVITHLNRGIWTP